MKRLSIWLMIICLTVSMSLTGAMTGSQAVYAQTTVPDMESAVTEEGAADADDGQSDPEKTRLASDGEEAGLPGDVNDSPGEDLDEEKAAETILKICEEDPLLFASASYPKLKTIDYTATGNQKKDIIGFAKTQVGYAEGKNNNTYFGHWYGLNYNPWCAMFVSWCAAKAGVPTSVIPKMAAADRSWAKKQKIYHKSKQWGGSYTPKKGDLIYFSWSVKDWADHIGLVSGTETIDGVTYVKTIEGNKRDKVVEDSYKLSNKYILGYASPKYASTEPTTYTLKYRDGLDETSDESDDAVIAPVTGKFGKKLTLADTAFTREGHYYQKWQIYRLSKKGKKLYLCRDKKTNKKEKWYRKDEIPKTFQKITVACGKKLKLSKTVSDTVYASPIWKKEKYEIKFNANGGVDAPKAVTKTYGEDLILPKAKPTRSDKTFLGWSLVKDATKADFKAGKAFRENGNLKLYAVWKPVTDVFHVKVTKDKGAKLYAGPDTTYENTGKAKKGKKLKIDKVQNGWGHIKGTENWLALRTTDITSGYNVKIKSNKVKLYTGPGKDNKSKGKIKPGTYEISKIDGTWGKVKKKGYWIDLDYTVRVKKD